MRRLNETEIRRLLERFYNGATTRQEERELAEWFAATHTVPEDLRADGEMFLAMADAAGGMPEMPEEHMLRITGTLEEEMARERRLRSRRGIWRRLTVIGGSAAACLLAGWIGYGVLMAPVTDTATPPLLAHAGGADTPADTLRPIRPRRAPAAPEESRPTASKARRTRPTAPDGDAGTPGNQGGLIAASVTRTQERHPEETDSETWTEEYDYTDYERELLAENYHVVRNAEEASAIVNSVFARLDGQTAEASYLMNDAASTYGMEIEEIRF